MVFQTQQFLRDHGLAALVDSRAISARRASAHIKFVFLKYDQLNSPIADPIVQEWR